MKTAIRLCMAVGVSIPVWVRGDMGGAPGSEAESATNVVDRDEAFLREVEAAVQKIRESYDQLRLRHEEISRRLRRSETARQAAERRQRELESKIASLTEDNTQLQLRLTRLTADLDDLRVRYEETLRLVDRLEERVATMDRQTRQLTREKEGLEAALQRERARADAAVEERTRLQATLEELRTRIATTSGAVTSATVSATEGSSDATAVARVRLETSPSPESSVAERGVPLAGPPQATVPSAGTAAHTNVIENAFSHSIEPPTMRIVEAPPSAPEPVLERLWASAAASTGTVASGESTIEQLLAEAARAGSEERWARARELYLEVLRQVPDDPVACVGLVEVELELGDTEGAWRRALALLEKSPDQPQRLLLAGRVALRAGRKAEARQFLERARELQPDKVTVLRELARLNFETLRYREAAELFERVGAADPQDGVSWFNAAVSWLKQDPPNIERAARCYRKAVELGEPRDERLEQRYGIQP